MADGVSLNIAMFGHKHMMSREGGIEIVIYELATRMSACGHKIVVYDRSSNHVAGNTEIDSRKEVDGVKIVPVWTMKRKGLAAVTSSLSAAWRTVWSSADVVHIHAEGPAAMCRLIKLLGKKKDGKKKRVIVTVHGLDWQRAKWSGFASKYIKFGEKQAVKWADEIIVLSRGVQEYFSSTYDRETYYIPNGVSRPEIVPAKLITDKFGLEKDGYLLFLGRIVPEKGEHHLIEAFKKIKTDKKLVIAGGASDSVKYMKKLKGMATGDDRIFFTGFVQGEILQELYSNAYLYVLPSDLEGMPLSLLEAMCYGNCCVVSDIDECTEVVEDKAIIFRKSDVEDLREKLQAVCDNPKVVQKMKAEAADFICGKYNWDEVVEKTLAVYWGNAVQSEKLTSKNNTQGITTQR